MPTTKNTTPVPRAPVTPTLYTMPSPGALSAEAKADRIERENSQLRKARRDAEQLPMLESGGSSDRFMFGVIVGTAITSCLGLVGVAMGVML